MSDLNISVTMTAKTCHSGHFYCVPHWMTSGYECPICANRRIGELISEKNILFDRLNSALKSNRSIRAYYAKKKGKKA